MLERPFGDRVQGEFCCGQDRSQRYQLTTGYLEWPGRLEITHKISLKLMDNKVLVKAMSLEMSLVLQHYSSPSPNSSFFCFTVNYVFSNSPTSSLQTHLPCRAKVSLNVSGIEGRDSLLISQPCPWSRESQMGWSYRTRLCPW